MNYTELDKRLREPYLIIDWIAVSSSAGVDEDAPFMTTDFRLNEWMLRSDLVMNKHSSEYVRTHTHESFEMMYVYEGKVTHVIDSDGGQRVELGQGDFLLFPPGTTHSVEKAVGCIAVNFLIKPAFWNADSRKLLRANYIFSRYVTGEGKRNEAMPVCLHIKPDGDEGVRSAFLDIMCEVLDPDISSFSSIRLLFLLLFNRLFRIWKRDGGAPPVRDSHEGGDIWDVIKYIELNYTDATLKEAAARFGYSSAYLSRLIKKRTGRSFIEIKHQSAMSRAAEYLKSTNLPVQSIARNCGLSNLNHFYALFDGAYNMTPAEYRRKHAGAG